MMKQNKGEICKEYWGVRVISDVSMTVVAGILCLVFLRKLEGVREGTIIAALITGNIVKVFTKKLTAITYFLLPKILKEEGKPAEDDR